MSYVRCVLLRATFAATAPRSAIAELGVVRRLAASPVRTIHISTLVLAFAVFLNACKPAKSYEVKVSKKLHRDTITQITPGHITANGEHRYAFEFRGRDTYFITCHEMTVGETVERVTKPVEGVNRLRRDPAYSCSILAYDCTQQWEGGSDTHKKFLCFFAIPRDTATPDFCAGDTDPESSYQLVVPSGQFLLHRINQGAAPTEFVRAAAVDVQMPLCIVQRTEYHPHVPYSGP